MTKKEKATFIVNTLEHLFPNPPIPLHHKDAYTMLIAVLLSAQCTDERVNKITPLLFETADNPKTMSQLSVEEIREIIKPCGLSPQKSKAIHQLSHILLEKYNGQVPNNMAFLEELPGVGHKTASVVMSQIFGEPTFPVDTHIHRLAYRWGLSDGSSVQQTEKNLKKTFDKSLWNNLHLQIIYYGRSFCKARPHDIENCPICKKIGIKSRL